MRSLSGLRKKHPDVDYTHLDTDTALHRERGLLGQRLGVDSSDMSSFCLWGDNAPMFNSNDSLFLFLFSILGCVDMTRYWLCCFPKRFMCNCGCKGRCTFDSVLDVIVWQFRVGVRGKAPRKRHDGILFKDSKKRGDKERAERAERGDTVPKHCCLKKKADWSWLKQVAGLQGWKTSIGGLICFVCGAPCSILLVKDITG